MRTLHSSPIVLRAILGPLALLLGYVGYRTLPGATISRSDALFRSLQLFALDYSIPSDKAPWSLNVARFLAPLTVVLATVIALMTLLREQVQRALVAAFARGHTVVVGLGNSGSLLAVSLRRSGQRVVVIEASSTNERISGIRAHGARVIIGDAKQSVILRRSRTARAAHVVVSTGDDSRNLEIAEQVRHLAIQEGRGRRTTVHVAIADQDLWVELGRLQLARIHSGLSIEFYNVVDRTAQTLLNEVERLGGECAYRSVLFEGDGPLAQRTLVHMVRRAALSGNRPQIHISQATADRVLSPISEREPWLGGLAAFLIDPARAALTSVSVVLVCLSASDATAMARALALSRSLSRPVYVSVRGQQTSGLLESAGVAGDVRLVTSDLKAVTDDFFHQSGPELMARVRHEEYVTRERSRGVTVRDNPSLVSWEDLPDSLKESNRRFADSIGEVLHALGGSLVPLKHLEPDQPFRDGPVLERLAVAEHERWIASLRRDGWVYGSGPKNSARKRHPLLVEWSDLSEPEREKDRDAVRAIPRMLARVGFAIEIPDASALDSPQHS